MLLFERSPDALTIYRAFEARVLGMYPSAEADVQKTQITFRDPRVFACASLPRRKVKDNPDACLVVTFGLPYRLEHPRIWQVSRINAGRWTHHALMAATGEADDELMGWVRESHDFSMVR